LTLITQSSASARTSGTMSPPTSGPRRRKRIRPIREGFNYQDHLAAIMLLDAFRSPRDVEVTLESNDGSHVDDLKVETADEVSHYQVKWASQPGAPYSFASLTERRTPNSASILSKFAKSWITLRRLDKRVKLHLYSNRLPSTSEGDLASVLQVDGSLAGRFFTDDLYEGVREGWRVHLRMGRRRFNDFAESLRFELGRENEETIREQLRLRLEVGRIPSDRVDKLLRLVQEWSVNRFEPVDKSMFFEALGLRLHRWQPSVRRRPEFDPVLIPDPDLMDDVDNRVRQLGNGYLFLFGTPGSGKTSFVAQYAKRGEQPGQLPVVEYYCFAGLDDPYARDRLRKSTFIAQLITSMSDSYPRLFAAHAPTDFGEERLGQMLQALSEYASSMGERIVFVVDGIDQVVHQELPLGERLTDGLPTTLPDGIIFFLSAQSPDQIPGTLARHLQEDRRRLTIGRFGLDRTHAYIKGRLEQAGALDAGFQLLTIDGARMLHEKADGLPLYLRYIVDLWLQQRPHDIEGFLTQFPSVDGDISKYYGALWPALDSANSYILSALASLSFPVDPEELASILDEPSLNRFGIEDALRQVAHLLKWDPENRVQIFHDSFQKFVLDRDPAKANEVHIKVYEYLRRDLRSERSRTRLFEYALKAGDLRTPIETCTREYLGSQLGDRRPPEEIAVNLGHALDAAARDRNLVALFRIGLVAYQLALADGALDRESVQRALLEMGEESAAMRYSWDGRNLVGNPKAALVLSGELGLRGRAEIARDIARAAVEQLRIDEHVRLDEIAAYYQARAILGRDMTDIWRSLTGSHSGWGADQRNELMTIIINALVESCRDDELAKLASIEGDTHLRSRLRIGEARAAARAGSSNRARTLLEGLARMEPKLSPENARATANALVDLGGSSEVLGSLLGLDPARAPTPEEVDYSSGADKLDSFYQQLRVRCHVGDTDGLEEIEAGLDSHRSSVTDYSRLLATAARALEPGCQMAELARDVRDQLISAFSQEAPSWAVRRALRHHLWSLIPQLLADVERRSEPALTAFAETLMEGMPRELLPVAREAVVSFGADKPGCSGLSRRLLEDAEQDHAGSVLGAYERVEGFFTLSSLAARMGDREWADRLFRRGTRSLLGHGYHKDIELFQFLDAADKLATLDPSQRFRRLAHLAEWCKWMGDVTDGDETSALPNYLTRALGEIDVVPALRLARQYEQSDVSFDWVDASHDLAEIVASHDTELAWGLARIGTRLGYEADVPQIRARLRVIQKAAAAGRADEVVELADETAALAQRVLPPKKSAAAIQAIADARGGRAPSREWATAGEGEYQTASEARRQGRGVQFEGEIRQTSEIQQLLRGSFQDFERVLRGVAHSDWSWVEAMATQEAERRISDADEPVLRQIENLPHMKGFRKYAVALALGRRYLALGNRERFMELAAEAHREALPWHDPWFGSDLAPFHEIAQVDRACAWELLYSSLAEAYKRSPWAAPSSLARLYEALPALGGGPYTELWSCAADHADELFAHLLPRQNTFDWLREWSLATDLSWPQAVVQFVADHLSWPELYTRERCLETLARLAVTRSEIALPTIVGQLTSDDLSQAALAAAAIHSAALKSPDSLAGHIDALQRLARSNHLQLVDTALEVLEVLVERGYAAWSSLDLEQVRSRLGGDPELVVPPLDAALVLPHLSSADRGRLQYWRPARETMCLLSEVLDTPLERLEWRVLREMDQLGYDEEAVRQDKQHLWRKYYDRGSERTVPFEDLHTYLLIHALARVAWQLLGECSPGREATECVLADLRQYDPALTWRSLMPRPDDVTMSGHDLGDDQWLNQADTREEISRRRLEAGWVTLSENRIIRSGERCESAGRHLALVRPGAVSPDLFEVLHRQGIPVIRLPSDPRVRNLRRKEAKARIDTMAGFGWHPAGVRPLTCAHVGHWRHGGSYSIAALDPQIARNLGLSWSDELSMDMSQDGEVVIRFEEWEEGSTSVSYGRWPTSWGSRLRAKTELAMSIVESSGSTLTSWEYAKREIEHPPWKRDDVPGPPTVRWQVVTLEPG
jgi:hypothetical protein